MKLVIDGRGYNVAEAIQKASISDLILLKRATKCKDLPNGVTVKMIMDFFESLPEPPEVPEGEESPEPDPDEPGLLELLTDSDAGLEVLRALIWLVRRKAGELASFDELTDVPIFTLGFEDDDEESEAVDPKDDEPEHEPLEISGS